MLFQVSSTPIGYIVEMYYDGYWRPLRNFGDRQGEARDYAFIDCKGLRLSILLATSNKFEPRAVYQRLKNGSYRLTN